METEKEREGQGGERARTSDKKTDITTKNSAYVSLKPR